jgi:hypothetical protein
MIESAQATLGGIKENSQSSKVPEQSYGAWRKIQRIQKTNLSKKKNAQPNEENKKQKERAQTQHWGAR